MIEVYSGHNQPVCAKSIFTTAYEISLHFRRALKEKSESVARLKEPLVKAKWPTVSPVCHRSQSRYYQLIFIVAYRTSCLLNCQSPGSLWGLEKNEKAILRLLCVLMQGQLTCSCYSAEAKTLLKMINHDLIVIHVHQLLQFLASIIECCPFMLLFWSIGTFFHHQPHQNHQLPQKKKRA